MSRRLHRWLATRLAVSAGIQGDHMEAIILRARRAEASQLDILWLCEVLDPVPRRAVADDSGERDD